MIYRAIGKEFAKREKSWNAAKMFINCPMGNFKLHETDLGIPTVLFTADSIKEC